MTRRLGTQVLFRKCGVDHRSKISAQAAQARHLVEADTIRQRVGPKSQDTGGSTPRVSGPSGGLLDGGDRPPAHGSAG